MARRKRQDKAKTQKRHADTRCLQRYGIPADQAGWVKQIQDGLARFIEKQSNRVSLWWVKTGLEGAPEIPVVYDKQRQTIVTVLTPEMIATRQSTGFARF